jgi:hypothetical protein
VPGLDLDRWAIARSGARGLLAAMAMTGMRTVTANLGLLEKSPPAAIVEQRAPRGIQRRLVHRAMLALDHSLYGVVVAGRLAPAPEVRPS